MSSKFLIFCVLIFCANRLLAQKMDGKFLVLTFEENYKVSQHGVKEYYWIVSTDSLETKSLLLSKLYLSDFSSDDLAECCLGVDVDPSLVFETTEYNFMEGYLESLNIFESLVQNNRRWLQTIKVKWENGQSKTVKVYATAIEGLFCFSNYHVIGRARDGYLGKVVLPYSGFKLFDEFWESHESQLKSKDFSQTNYWIIE